MGQRLRELPPLVFAGEARALLAALGEVCEGRAFLLQAGDCVESFREVSAPGIREKLKVMLQMSAVLTYGATLPVVKVGRIAGQFGKPRSSRPSSSTASSSRRFGAISSTTTSHPRGAHPDPGRLLQGYYQSASTLNLLRAFTKGGFADLTHVHTWNREFVASSPAGQRYEALAGEIERALRFMEAIGIDLGRERTLHEVDIWTSHEGLLLDYEEALTRTDSLTGRPTTARPTCSGSATAPASSTAPRRVLLRRVESDRGQARPFRDSRTGCRARRAAQPRAGTRPADVHRAHGSGARPRAAPAAPRGGAPRRSRSSGYATRCTRTWCARPRAVRRATSGRSWTSCTASSPRTAVGTWPGGVHLEFTGEEVTECLGGAEEIRRRSSTRYETLCDPRLNGRQALDLAFRVAELMRAL